MSTTYSAVCDKHRLQIYALTRTGGKVVVGISSRDPEGHHAILDFIEEHQGCGVRLVGDWDESPLGYHQVNDDLPGKQHEYRPPKADNVSVQCGKSQVIIDLNEPGGHEDLARTVSAAIANGHEPVIRRA